MKKSKWFLTCVALVLCFATIFATTGCSNKSDGVTPDGGTGGGGGTENPPVVETDPVLENMSAYFSGARVMFDNSTIADEDNTQQNFTNLLNRQFEVLSEDILHRLNIVYGANSYGPTASKDKQLGENYSLNGNAATVVKKFLLTNLTTHDANIAHAKYEDGALKSNIDCIYCYLDPILTGTQTHLNSRQKIILQNAITGRYATWSNNDIVLSSIENPDKAWKTTDLASIAVKNEVKMAIAKIVAGDADYNTTTFSDNDYQNVLNRINNLGFIDEEEIKLKIVDTINSKIIGSARIEENLASYALFRTEEEKKNIRYDMEEGKHLFKGYNIVVPAIVDMALHNTFENTSTSLYPVASKKTSEINNFSQLASAKAYSEVYLMPKENNIKPTKINFNIVAGPGSANKTIGIKVIVHNAQGVVKTINVANVRLSGAAEKISVLLDTAAIGAFTGNSTDNFGSTSLFGGNNVAMPQDNILLGKNYIKFEFENLENASFGLEFLGMYDKVK